MPPISTNGKRTTRWPPHLPPRRRMIYARKTFVQKPRRDAAEMYLSVHPSIISFFSLHFTLFFPGPWSATPWAAYQGDVKCVREMAFESARLGFSSTPGWGRPGGYPGGSSPCEEMLTADAWLRWQCRWVRPGCPPKCDTPHSWGDAGKIGKRGFGGRRSGIAFWLVTRDWAQSAWASLYVWRIHGVKVFGPSELFIILPGWRGQEEGKKGGAEKCIQTPPVTTAKTESPALHVRCGKTTLIIEEKRWWRWRRQRRLSSPDDVEPCCITWRNVPKTMLLPTQAGRDETLLWQWAKIPSDFLSTDVFAAEYYEQQRSISMFWHKGGHLINSWRTWAHKWGINNA